MKFIVRFGSCPSKLEEKDVGGGAGAGLCTCLGRKIGSFHTSGCVYKKTFRLDFILLSISQIGIHISRIQFIPLSRTYLTGAISMLMNEE
jgi:hypothetical protein